MSDLWMEASRDIEAENAADEMTRAKMKVASLWPFLAQSATQREFEHRLALAEDRIDRLVPDAAQHEHVMAAFREDYRIYREAEAIYAEPEPVEHVAATAPLRIFHEASGQWITVEGAAQPTPQNINNHIEPEDGPITGNTGTFPVMVNGPDPHNPIQDQFPMQPTQWHDNTTWVERPMNFAPYKGPYQASARTAADGYVDEGVQTGPGPNPYFFSGGGEGAAGNQQAGFPADLTLPEPDERVDAYGAVPPVQSGGSSGGDVPYSNAGKQAAKDNHGKCAGDGCNRPVFRRGNTWHHLDGEQDHHVLLDRDHPWVQQRMSARRPHLKEAGFFDPADPSVGWLRVEAEVSSSDMGPSSGGEGGDGSPGTEGGAPNPPPSMISGGPGAQAMEPMTIPGPTSTSNPFSPGSGGGGGGGQQQPMMGAPAAPMQPMARFVPRQQRFADVRERPTADNPNGVGDEYEANNWETAIQQSPRQAPEMRGVNTPQRARQPIPQVSSDGFRDDEEEERE